MMIAHSIQVGVLIIQTLFSLYVYVLLLRLFLQKWSAHWHNPICQFTIRTTEFLVKPIGRILPGFKGFDLSIVALAVVVQLLGIYVEMWLRLGVFPAFFGMLLMSIALLLSKVIHLFIVAIIITALASWFPALQDNPIIDVTHLLALPFMRLGRRYVPLIGGLDLSPIVVLLLLKIIDWVLLDPWISWGLALSLQG